MGSAVALQQSHSHSRSNCRKWRVVNSGFSLALLAKRARPPARSPAFNHTAFCSRFMASFELLAGNSKLFCCQTATTKATAEERI